MSLEQTHIDMGDLTADEMASHETTPFGPSSDAICRVTNGNTCGSGTLVGKRNGKSLILTNAHVAGTKIGTKMSCYFPKLQKSYAVRLIMAGYSDSVMMDWAILEAEEIVPLPHTKLKNATPQGEHYTGGYPRCKGPYYQKLVTRSFTYNGTVWRWQPNSIGGQSGSGVHSFADNLLYGLLTWSWGGDGAGQTVRSIWFQYANRAAVGFPKPPDLIELGDNRAAHLEEGFFQETDITTLPIWAHIDDDTPTDPDEPGPAPAPELAKEVMRQAEEWIVEAGKLAELARKYSGGGGNPPADEDNTHTDGPLFGL